MYKRRQANQKRVRYRLMPLFSGYLFFKGDDEDRYQALRSNQIANILDARDPEKLVKELKDINRALFLDIQVYPYDFVSEEQLVKVKKGPLKDVEGVIVRKDRNYRLVLSVSTIRQSMAVTIDADMVGPAT